MKKIFILTLFLGTFLTSFNPAYSISPDVFIQSTVNRASQVLSENISKEEKINKLKLIAKETVDIRGVGFYSLGAARKSLNNEQKNTYTINSCWNILFNVGIIICCCSFVRLIL